jgi:hypothetical protein
MDTRLGTLSQSPRARNTEAGACGLRCRSAVSRMLDAMGTRARSLARQSQAGGVSPPD